MRSRLAPVAFAMTAVFICVSTTDAFAQRRTVGDRVAGFKQRVANKINNMSKPKLLGTAMVGGALLAHPGLLVSGAVGAGKFGLAVGGAAKAALVVGGKGLIIAAAANPFAAGLVIGGGAVYVVHKMKQRSANRAMRAQEQELLAAEEAHAAAAGVHEVPAHGNEPLHAAAAPPPGAEAMMEANEFEQLQGMEGGLDQFEAAAAAEGASAVVEVPKLVARSSTPKGGVRETYRLGDGSTVKVSTWKHGNGKTVMQEVKMYDPAGKPIPGGAYRGKVDPSALQRKGKNGIQTTVRTETGGALKTTTWKDKHGNEMHDVRVEDENGSVLDRVRGKIE